MALLPALRTSDESTPDDADSWGDTGLDGGGKMTFLEHLDELRKRLTVSLAAILVGLPGRVHVRRQDLQVHHGSPEPAAAEGEHVRLHRADRSVRPVPEDGAAGRRHHRGARHPAAGLALHRAGPVCEGEAPRGPVHRPGDGGVRGRRRLHALPAVPLDVGLLRQFRQRETDVPAADRAGVRAVREDGPRDGPRLPDARRRLHPRAHRPGHGAIPDQAASSTRS